MRRAREESVGTGTLEAIPEHACRFHCHFGQVFVYLGGRGCKDSNGVPRGKVGVGGGG